MIDRDHLIHLLSPREWLLRLVFWGGALAVGTTAVLFAMGAQQGQQYFVSILSASPWLPFIVMPAGLALSRRVFAGAQGSGIPQTIAALQIGDEAQLGRLLSLRIAAGKIGLTLLALCCGASIGREGPTVQVGASIMYSLRKISRLSYRDQLGGLIVAGGAAGVAAAFNTPLAGIAFAIEELSRSFEQRTNGLVLTAVIFAGLAANAVLGNYAYFGTISTSLGSGTGWAAVGICGVAGGFAGGLFSRLLIRAGDGWHGRAGNWIGAHPVAFAAVCGMALAGLGVLSGHHTYGTGYEEVKDILAHGDAGYAGYGLYKFLATLVSYLSGIPGGIFAPSLAIGAGMGASISHYLPFIPAGTVIVLGMVAYFSGVTQAPLTTFIIVMEMTDNHNLVLPLMATALVGHGVSRVVCREPLYKALAQRFVDRLPLT
jgi:H+/Cl- antiporter ClcA